MSEWTKKDWSFPEKLRSYNPKGKMFEKVFADPIALPLYVQYRRNHLVDDVTNEFLSTVTLKMAEQIRQTRANKQLCPDSRLRLDQLVQIWYSWWMRHPGSALVRPQAELDREYWPPVLEPILDFINEVKRLKFVEQDNAFWLITETPTMLNTFV
jgi:hypothetical protein